MQAAHAGLLGFGAHTSVGYGGARLASPATLTLVTPDGKGLTRRVLQLDPTNGADPGNEIADDGVLWCRRDAGRGWMRPSFGAVRSTPPMITPATLWEARVWGGDVEHHLWGDGAVSGRTARLRPSVTDPSVTDPTAPADGVLRLAGRAQIANGQAFARCTLPGRLVTVLPVVDGVAGDGCQITLRSHSQPRPSPHRQTS
ncbi:MAG: hypothetical protein ACT4NY_18090 [Pseudonocardiales bacterium]